MDPLPDCPRYLSPDKLPRDGIDDDPPPPNKRSVLSDPRPDEESLEFTSSDSSIGWEVSDVLCLPDWRDDQVFRWEDCWPWLFPKVNSATSKVSKPSPSRPLTRTRGIVEWCGYVQMIIFSCLFFYGIVWWADFLTSPRSSWADEGRGIFVFCAWRSGSLLGAEVSTAQVSRNSYHGTTPR